MKLRLICLLCSFSLLTPAALAQDSSLPKPPPLPRKDAPAGKIKIDLQPTKEIVTIYLTGLAALKHCRFDGKDKLALLGDGYGLRPGSVDPAIAKPILDGIDAEVKRNRSDFCLRAWDLYGPRGTTAKGVLSIAGTAEVAGWIVEPDPFDDPVSCLAFRRGQDGLRHMFTKNFWIFRQLGAPDLEFALASRTLKLEPADKKVDAAIEIGSAAKQLRATIVDKNEINIPLDKELTDGLNTSGSFVIRVQGQALAIPVTGWRDVLAKLEACAAIHDKDAANQNSNRQSAPTSAPQAAPAQSTERSKTAGSPGLDVTALSAAIREHPDDPELYARRADAHMAAGAIDEAIADYEQAMRRKPKNVDLLRRQALAYQAKGDMVHAIANLRVAQTIAPDDRDIEQALKEARARSGSATPASKK